MKKISLFMCNLVAKIILVLTITPALINAQDVSVAQTGNIIVIKSKQYGDYVLIGDPGFKNINNYEFSIDLPSKENDSEQPAKQPDQPAKQEDQQQAKNETQKEINDIPVLLEKANVLYNAGKYVDALLLVESAVKLDPTSARAMAMRGSLKSVLGDVEGATKDWTEAKKLDPNPKLKRQLESELPRQ